MSDTEKSIIISDVKKFVWKKDPKDVVSKMPASFQNKKFRELFFQIPRLRFDGYYYCTESYFRKGIPDLNSYYSPIHYVKSYRYLRYFDNGLVLYHISTRKIKRDSADTVLTIENYEKNKVSPPNSRATYYLGEYITSFNKIWIKMPDKGYINEMEHDLQVDEHSGFTYFKVLNHVIRDAETGRNHPMELDISSKERVYYYTHVKKFENDQTITGIKSLYHFWDESKKDG